MLSQTTRVFVLFSLVGEADLEVRVARAFTRVPLAVAAVPVAALSRRVEEAHELDEDGAVTVHLLTMQQRVKVQTSHCVEGGTRTGVAG